MMPNKDPSGGSDKKRKGPQPVDDDGKWLLKRGALIGNLANTIQMVRALPLRYNSFTCVPYLEDKSPWGTSGAWSDYDDIRCAEWCQRAGLEVGKNTVSDAVIAVSGEREPFHSVLDYLGKLEWDRKPRVDRWLYKYMGCHDTPYVRGVAAMWMMSAVKRVHDPNAEWPNGEPPNCNQADYTLVLEGQQGRRKSTALRVLTGSEWFSDDLGAEIPHKDAAAGLQGKWIVEMSELDAIRKAEMTAVKAWLTRRTDHYRPSYGRRSQDFKRQTVFAGSTNKDQWIEDETGGRRFWPVKVGVLDIDGLARDRNQLWAEAFHRFMAGERTYFDDDGEGLAAEQQSQRQVTDAWRDRIESWVLNPKPKGEIEMRSRFGRAYMDDIMRHCIGLEPKDHNQATKRRVSAVLTLAGWVTKRESAKEADEDGIQREYWYPMKKTP